MFYTLKGAFKKKTHNHIWFLMAYGFVIYGLHEGGFSFKGKVEERLWGQGAAKGSGLGVQGSSQDIWESLWISNTPSLQTLVLFLFLF